MAAEVAEEAVADVAAAVAEAGTMEVTSIA